MAFDDDSQSTCRPIFQAHQVTFCFFNGRKDFVGQFQQAVADGGKGDRNGFSLEKGSVIGFEKPDLLGEGRLGQAQHFRRFGQVAGFAQGKQGSEMLQIYH